MLLLLSLDDREVKLVLVPVVGTLEVGVVAVFLLLLFGGAATVMDVGLGCATATAVLDGGAWAVTFEYDIGALVVVAGAIVTGAGGTCCVVCATVTGSLGLICSLGNTVGVTCCDCDGVGTCFGLSSCCAGVTADVVDEVEVGAFVVALVDV